MIVSTLLVGLLLCWTGSAAPSPAYRLVHNSNNIDSRVPAPGASTPTVQYLGLHTNFTSCLTECVSQLGPAASSGSGGCQSAVLHGAEGWFGPEWRHGCYGVNGSFWAPAAAYNVTSAQADPTRVTSPCSTDRDCSYNGECADGRCQCRPAWMGVQCGQLRTVPTPREAGLQASLDSQRVSSWGGSVWLDDATGVYEMFAASFVNGCGIRTWITNSEVVRATLNTTNSTAWAFTQQEVVFPVWGHEPTAARDPTTGEYVLFWSRTDPGSIPCSNHTCTACANGVSSNADPDTCPNGSQCPQLPHGGAAIYTAFSSAPHASGPWTEPEALQSPLGRTDTNFSPLILPNGTLVGLARPPWVARASDWRNASTYEWFQAVGGLRQEDPFLYQEAGQDDVLHALLHGGGWNGPFGYHFASDDGGRSWTTASVELFAYDSELTHPDGTFTSLSRRERPHLMFNSAGVPVALTNGASPNWPCTAPDTCPNDRSFTALQWLNQA